MSWEEKYKQIRSSVKPGDIFAFSGVGFFSNVIKFATQSPISHVAVSFFDEDDRLTIFESTTLSQDGRKGVHKRYLSDVLRTYPGAVAWCPLRADLHAKLDQRAFFTYLKAQEGKSYGYIQAVLAGLHVPMPSWDLHQFCSEIIMFSFVRGHLLDPSVDPSETTPAELFSYKLYAPGPPIIIKGDMKVKNYNNTDIRLAVQ